MRKIERLIYTNEQGGSIEFSRLSPFHVNMNDVTGLSVVRNTLYSSNSMGQDGDTYIGGRIEPRDIDIPGSFRTRDKAHAQELRQDLLRIFNPKLSGTLLYEFGIFRRIIGCRVESANGLSGKVLPRFSIELKCLNPYWRAEVETRSDVAQWVGGLEFPVDLHEGWRIGYRSPATIVNVYNNGDVSSGLRAEFRALGEVVNPSITNAFTREFFKVNMTLQYGDVLTVTTGYGDKTVTLLRDGEASDAFRYHDPDSTFLSLESGDNLIRYDADESPENLVVTIYHYDQYLGV